MKTLIQLVALGCWLGVCALAQETHLKNPAVSSGTEVGTNQPITLRPAEAKAHVGANAVITGKVAEVNQGPSVVRLNFDEPYPKQSFTAIVFSRYTNQFSKLEGLKGQTIEVKGRITLYRGRPELQLESTNQLRVLEVPAGATTKP